MKDILITKSEIASSVKIMLPNVLKVKLADRAKKNCRTLANEILYIILDRVMGEERINKDFLKFIKKFIDSRKRLTKQEK